MKTSKSSTVSKPPVGLWTKRMTAYCKKRLASGAFRESRSNSDTPLDSGHPASWLADSEALGVWLHYFQNGQLDTTWYFEHVWLLCLIKHSNRIQQFSSFLSSGELFNWRQLLLPLCFCLPRPLKELLWFGCARTLGIYSNICKSTIWLSRMLFNLLKGSKLSTLHLSIIRTTRFQQWVNGQKAYVQLYHHVVWCREAKVGLTLASPSFGRLLGRSGAY